MTRVLRRHRSLPMKTMIRFSIRSLLLPLALSTALLPLGSCVESNAAGEAAARSDDRAVDAPLHDYQVEQLELAFETASKLPLVPHVKNRAKAQKQVVDTCLELDQPQRALRCIERIPNWRRGLGLADYAYYCVEHGAEDVQTYLDRASAIADDPTDETLPGWRRSRIRARISQVYALLGRSESAARFGKDLEESELRGLAVLKARLADEGAFDDDLEATDSAIQAGSMDQVQASLEQCVAYFDRYYDDVERRDRAQSRIEQAEGKLPLLIHLELVGKLADAALSHGDPAKARELVAWLDRLIADQHWLPRHELPVVARTCVLRHRAGEVERAREDADEALARFREARGSITDVFRVEALLPLAEAYHAMGDTGRALEVYAMAVEDAVHNPNSRPRAMDLTALLCSMARNDVEPDSRLHARLLEVCGALGAPW